MIMNSFRKSVSFLGQFTAFSVAVALAAVYIGGTVSKTASVFFTEGQSATVVVDAGHGGRDGGAVADDGTLEKELEDVERELYGDAATDYKRVAELDARKTEIEDRLLEIYTELE